MRKTILSGLLIFIVALFTIAGCKSTGTDITHDQPTSATLNIMSQGTLASGQQIGAVDVTVNLPAGVTVQTTADNGVLVMNDGVAVASGVTPTTNTILTGSYTAATATDPGKVAIKLANANGFGIGEFVTVHCDIATGSFPTAADFNLTGFKAYDLNGAVISGLTPTSGVGFTVDIK